MSWQMALDWITYLVEYLDCLCTRISFSQQGTDIVLSQATIYRSHYQRHHTGPRELCMEARSNSQPRWGDSACDSTMAWSGEGTHKDNLYQIHVISIWPPNSTISTRGRLPLDPSWALRTDRWIIWKRSGYDRWWRYHQPHGSIPDLICWWSHTRVFAM